MILRLNVLVILIIDSFVVFCLQCYTCNQRAQNATTCLTQTIEDCSITYPGKPTVCLRSVQRSFDGHPPWVFAQCHALGMPTDPLLNQCEMKQVRGRQQELLYTLEICTCTENLCNSRSDSVAVVQPPPISVTTSSTRPSLQCYKCNQRLQGALSCQNPTIEDCDQVLPWHDSVCIRRVQTFANGDPPWVLAQCEPSFGTTAAAGTDVAPNGRSCNTSYVRLETGQFDVIETCVCSVALCNGDNAINSFPTPSGELISSTVTIEIHPLRCYKCSERLINATECANRTVEDCAVQFPNQPVSCVRSVQTFSDGQAPWVVERCQIRAHFPEADPSDCWSQPLTGVNASDHLHFCTCVTDLCNDEKLMNSNASIHVFKESN